MLKCASVFSFVDVLTNYSLFFCKNTVSLFETFMTIYSMNKKSGTNGILPHRIKRDITLDLRKQMI